MSINAIINNSLTGLFTNQAALRATSNNVANINTPGYARQIVQQEAVINGSQMGGVKISAIIRAVDKFLVSSVYDANANFSRLDVENAFHTRIQSLLGRPDQNNSLSGRVDDMFSALSDVGLNPQSAILKERTLSTINQFGGEIGALLDQIQVMRMDASNQIAEKIERVNSLTKKIQELNPLIVRETLVGGEPGSLMESRAQAITELSSIIDLHVINNSNNNLQINTAGGVGLVGTTRSVLQYAPPGVVTSSIPFSPITIHPVDPVSGAIRHSNNYLDNKLSSGEIKGLLNMRDKELPEIALQLGSLAAGFADELNRVHNLNSAVPAANSLIGRNTGLLASDNHNFTGEAVFAVTDTSGNLVAKTTVDFGAIGGTVTDVINAVNTGLGGTATMGLSNGVLSLTATGATNGVSVSPVFGNEALRGGRGFGHFFGLNDLVETQWPSHYETGVSGTDAHGFTPGDSMELQINDDNGVPLSSYTLTIAGTSFNDILTDLNASPLASVATFSLSAEGALVATPINSEQNIRLYVQSDDTARGSTNVPLSLFFGIGDTFQVDRAIGLRVRTAINNNPNLTALARLDQTALVGENALSVGDQTGALALSALENTTHSFAAAGGLGAATVTLTQYSANLLANLGLRASLTESSREDFQALSEELNRKSSDVSGVNLDEEISNMVIYQNAYSASARLLNTAKEMFDAILAIT